MPENKGKRKHADIRKHFICRFPVHNIIMFRHHLDCALWLSLLPEGLWKS